jgi:hypothetical protein
MLRVVRKLQSQLPLSSEAEDSSGALGDWYVKRFVVQRRPYLMIVSSTSLLAMIERAKDVRSLPLRLPGLVGERLVRMGISRAVIDAEIRAMQPVRIGPTIDRTVVGAMVNYCMLVEYRGDGGNYFDMELEAEESFLWQTPMLTSRGQRAAFFPEERVRELLEQRWPGMRRLELMG